MKFGKIGLTCISLFLLSALSIAAFAQNNGAGAAPGGGRQGRGQGRQGGFNRAPSLATIPVSTLSSYLKLTADQKTKIEAIQAQYKEAAKAFTIARPAPGEQVDRQAMQEMMQKRQEATAKSDSDIKAVLTDDQTKLLEPMNKELATYQSVGIQAGVVGELKLTDGEHLKIMTIAEDSTKERTAKMAELQGGDRAAMQAAFAELQKSTKEKIMAVLTPSQKTVLEAYDKEHPMNQRGFGGGGGGRRGGAGAAPPPPVH